MAQDDPFARIADVLPTDPGKRRTPAPRRSRTAFSELAPVVVMPPQPPVVITHLPSKSRGSSPDLPSVIVAPEPATMTRASQPMLLDATVRDRRTLKKQRRRRMNVGVLLCLAISAGVFAAGVASFLSARPAPALLTQTAPPVGQR